MEYIENDFTRPARPSADDKRPSINSERDSCVRIDTGILFAKGPPYWHQRQPALVDESSVKLHPNQIFQQLLEFP